MSNVIYLKYILSKIINELDLGAGYLTYFMRQFDEKKPIRSHLSIEAPGCVSST